MSRQEPRRKREESLRKLRQAREDGLPPDKFLDRISPEEALDLTDGRDIGAEEFMAILRDRDGRRLLIGEDLRRRCGRPRLRNLVLDGATWLHDLAEDAGSNCQHERYRSPRIDDLVNRKYVNHPNSVRDEIEWRVMKVMLYEDTRTYDHQRGPPLDFMRGIATRVIQEITKYEGKGTKIGKKAQIAVGIDDDIAAIDTSMMYVTPEVVAIDREIEDFKKKVRRQAADELDRRSKRQDHPHKVMLEMIDSECPSQAIANTLGVTLGAFYTMNHRFEARLKEISPPGLF